MQGHFDEVCCMAISPNGKYLISGGKDRIVRIWDI
jgi:ribosomal RNA-processing protein 9